LLGVRKVLPQREVMLPWPHHPGIRTLEQDQSRSHRNRLEDARRDLIHADRAVARADEALVDLLVRKTWICCHRRVDPNLQTAVRVEHVRSALGSQRRAAAAEKLVPVAAIDALVVAGLDVCGQAETGASRADALADEPFLAREIAVARTQLATAISDQNRALA